MRGQRRKKKKDQGGLAGWNREGKERDGCQHQGGPLALNGSLVRKVEGEEAQIKDVPSLKRKSSHPWILKGCLKGEEEEREARRQECLCSEGRKSFRHPAARQQTGVVQGCRRFPQPHDAMCCPSVHHMLHTQAQETHYKHLHTHAVDKRVNIKVKTQSWL